MLTDLQPCPLSASPAEESSLEWVPALWEPLPESPEISEGISSHTMTTRSSASLTELLLLLSRCFLTDSLLFKRNIMPLRINAKKRNGAPMQMKCSGHLYHCCYISRHSNFFHQLLLNIRTIQMIKKHNSLLGINDVALPNSRCIFVLGAENPKHLHSSSSSSYLHPSFSMAYPKLFKLDIQNSKSKKSNNEIHIPVTKTGAKKCQEKWRKRWSKNVLALCAALSIVLFLSDKNIKLLLSLWKGSTQALQIHVNASQRRFPAGMTVFSFIMTPHGPHPKPFNSLSLSLPLNHFFYHSCSFSHSLFSSIENKDLLLCYVIAKITFMFFFFN